MSKVLKNIAIIGRRDAPAAEIDLVYRFSAAMARMGHKIVTGGAAGIDQAAIDGAKSVGGKLQIFVPWSGYNGYRSGAGVMEWSPSFLGDYDDLAALHPKVKIMLDRGVRKDSLISLMGRNAMIIDHSDVVVAIPKRLANGVAVGGTLHGMNVAAVLEKQLIDASLETGRKILEAAIARS